jgi:hypothetical protein
MSRLGAVALSLSSIFIPFHLNSLLTPCFIEYYEVVVESSLSSYSSSSYSSSYSSTYSSSYSSSYSYASSPDETSSSSSSSSSSEGFGLLKGLVIVSVLNLSAFFVALGSLDPHRETVYAEFEDMNHYQTTKQHLKLVANKQPKARKSFRRRFSAGSRPPPPTPASSTCCDIDQKSKQYRTRFSSGDCPPPPMTASSTCCDIDQRSEQYCHNDWECGQTNQRRFSKSKHEINICDNV